MRIAITTPTGHVGSKLTALLLDEGQHLLALLARHPERLAAAERRGATIIETDLQDATGVRQATEKAESLFWVMPPKPDARDVDGYYDGLARNASAAVHANKIPHVVYLSSMGAHVGRGTGPVLHLARGEQVLSEASSSLIILRPALYMEDILMALPGIAASRTIAMPAPRDARVAMIATRDVAAGAAQALTEIPREGTRIMPLLGPRDYSFAEVAEIIGQALGQPVRYVQTSPEQTRTALLGMGLSEAMADLYLEMYDGIARGLLVPEHPRSDETTTPTTFEEFARREIVPALQAQHS